MYLREIKNFYFKILELLKVEVIPRAVFIHELNRVGYSYMGNLKNIIKRKPFCKTKNSDFSSRK